MDNQYESQSNRIAKLQEKLRNYYSFTTNLKQSFKRDYNDMKIELSQKEFELNTLKQQLKEQTEIVQKQTKEIEQLKQTLKLIIGEDSEVESN